MNTSFKKASGPFIIARLPNIHIDPNENNALNLEGIMTMRGKNVNETNIIRRPKKKKMAKCFQFVAAVCTSCILFVNPVIVSAVFLKSVLLILENAFCSSPDPS